MAHLRRLAAPAVRERASLLADRLIALQVEAQGEIEHELAEYVAAALASCRPHSIAALRDKTTAALAVLPPGEDMPRAALEGFLAASEGAAPPDGSPAGDKGVISLVDAFMRAAYRDALTPALCRRTSAALLASPPSSADGRTAFANVAMAFCEQPGAWAVLVRATLANWIQWQFQTAGTTAGADHAALKARQAAAAELAS